MKITCNMKITCTCMFYFTYISRTPFSLNRTWIVQINFLSVHTERKIMWLTIKCYFNYFQYNDNKYLIDLITFYTVLTFHQFQKAGSCSAEVKPDHSQMLTTIFHIIPNAYYNFSHYTVLCNISYKAENEIF
jgi:hypothetical protein